jgi:hypothetical protein
VLLGVYLTQRYREVALSCAKGTEEGVSGMLVSEGALGGILNAPQANKNSTICTHVNYADDFFIKDLIQNTLSTSYLRD